MKTHLIVDDRIACGRSAQRSSDKVRRVDCGTCEKTPEYAALLAVQKAAELAAFNAQTPRQISEPWREGLIICKGCGHDTFREADRSCYGHYANYVCATCGGTESRLTETGMSF